MIDGEDVDDVAPPLEAPAGAARGRVPTADGNGAADAGEVGNLGQRAPTEAGDQAVVAVGAGDLGQRAGRVVVRRVVGNCAG